MADKDIKKTKAAPKAASKAKKVDLHALSVEQLREELSKVQAEHLESRRSHRQGELVNPHILTTQRKSIARHLTALGAAQRVSQKEEN